ncbi:MAG: AI-2E family transporter [Lachnospiraceae bacterium]|nr:AI-2E family transporter [Lachnospiraceae bacterium]
MNLNQKNMRKIKGLILFTAVVILALLKFDFLCTAFLFVLGIMKPFLIGGMIAFVIHIPMGFYEKKLFSGRRGRPAGKFAQKWGRGISLIMAYLSVVLVVTLVLITVIPQLIETVGILANKLPVFYGNLIQYLEVVFEENPQLSAWLESLEMPEVNWDDAINMVINFLKNGLGSMLSSTVTVAGSIISNTVNFFIALIFSIYLLIQKEKLLNQFDRLLTAYTRPKLYKSIRRVLALLNQNFSNFISGQCTEAVILGLMFVVSMTIFGFDYAVMIGVLIAFTALIPIVGAFIGCFVGAFLMLVDDPVKALWFVVLFIILQQIEGNLIYPHVVGNSVGLPSIWVLAAVTVGGSLMGVLGMLVFIPLLSTVYVLLRDDVNRRNKESVMTAEKMKAGKT